MDGWLDGKAGLEKFYTVVGGWVGGWMDGWMEKSV